MKILLFGKSGQLGWELQRTLLPLGEVKALDFPEIDLSNEFSIRENIIKYQPNLIINAAAYTAVDQAEINENKAISINADCCKYLSEEANRINASLIHFSTDYVFDGKKRVPYTEIDSPNPINIYGKSKVMGEEIITNSAKSYFIFRLAWLYSNRGDNFVLKVLKWSREQKLLRVANDQIGSPSWARLISIIIGQTLSQSSPDLFEWIKEHRGIYHLAGDGEVTRFEWAKKILDLDPNQKSHTFEQVIPVSGKDFKTLAIRPEYCALNCEKFYSTFHLKLPNWETSLALAISS